jgi:hypothetical protein
MAYFLPPSLLLFCEPWGFQSSEGPQQPNEAAILSCTSTPPRRVYLKQTVFLSASYVDRKPLLKNTSLKLRDPTAYSGHQVLQSSMNSFELMSGKLYPTYRKPRFRVWLPS